MSEELLAATLAAIRAGDRERFADIVERYQDDVRRFLAARCRTVAEVEELVQNTFVTAYGSLDAWTGEGAFAAWLLGIARNHARHLARSCARERRTPLDRLDRLLAAPVEEDGADDRLIDRLRRCLQRLPEPHRELVVRRHGEGLGLDELAAALASTKAVLATRLMRLRQTLRACVEGGS